MFKQIGGGQHANRNMLASPLSISAALAMTYAGARGLTAQQMADTLHFPLPDDRLNGAFAEMTSDLNATRPGYQLSIANRLFGQQDLRYQQPFLDVLAQNYHAPLETMDFRNAPESARVRINDWVEDQTKDKIRDLLPPGIITENTSLVLTNAIYFDGKWKYKFDEDSTHDALLYESDGTATSTAMMFQRQQLRYGDFDGYKMLEMQYAGDDLSIVLMLRDEHDGLQSLETSLSAEGLHENLAAMTERDVNVWLPKFKFEASFKLRDALMDMGMTEAFQNGGLTGIADGDFRIDDVLRKAFIDVTEAGTEAAATTAVIIVPTNACYCSPPQPEEFRADHLFLFALRDRHSGSLMFMGRVAEPGESTILSLAGPNVPEPASLALLFVGLACAGRVRR